MGPIQVIVTDANNLTLEVTPTASTTVILDRGIAGPVGPMGDGDVDGPASSTDNAVARFDGTTGKLIQNSLATISDTGALTAVDVVATANPLVQQSDIGSAPNEIPLNQYLGNLAYQNASNIAGPVVVGGTLTVVSTIQALTGPIVQWQPAPASISAAATLTNANIQSQIVVTTGTTFTLTMPLGSSLDTLIEWATNDIGYDFSVINTASGTITMAANTGVTIVGRLTILTAISARFRIRRTAASTYIMYRLS